MTTIRSDRLILRPPTLADAEPLYAVFGNPEVMRYSDGGAQTLDFIQGWLGDMAAGLMPDWRLAAFTIVETGSGIVIGYAGLTREDDRCEPGETEINYRLARAYWNNGYGTEAARAVTGHGFRAFNAERIIATIDPNNGRSIRVARNLGMRFLREVMYPDYDYPDHVYGTERPPVR